MRLLRCHDGQGMCPCPPGKVEECCDSDRKAPWIPTSPDVVYLSFPPITPQSSTRLSYLVPVGFELDLIWVMMLEVLCVLSLALLCTPHPDTRRFPGELYFSAVWGWLIASPAKFSDGSPPITWQNGGIGHRGEDGIMQQKVDRVLRLAWRRSHLMLCHQESWKHALS